jgi:hypothetical protein
MTRPGETKVTVRVEVVVEGYGEEPHVTTVTEPFGRTPRRRFKVMEILNPGGGSLVPVFPYNGQMCIEADGECLTSSSGSFPGRVRAMVFPGPNPSGLPSSPPPGAASDVPTLDGKWSFKQSKGNPVPGATCGGSGSGNNNTLVVWYDFGSGIPYSSESTPFVGYCVSGGPSGSGSGIGVPPPPGTLHAGFSGALASLGTVALAWSGVGWLGAASGCGGSLLMFFGDGTSYTLVATGPGVLFSVTNSPNSASPFSWSASGSALGSCAGAFDVVITE